jgi:hypothetical protein
VATHADQSFLDMSSDELEVFIGTALLRDEFGSKDVSDAEKRAVAQRWFSSNLDEFRTAICGSGIIQDKLFGPQHAERNLLFGAVVDALGALRGLPVPVAALSAQVIHYGLRQLCAEPLLTEGRAG